MIVRSRMPVERSDGDVLRAVVDDVLVDFIGDGERIPFVRTSRRIVFQFLARKHFAGRIVRRIEDDRLACVC